MSPGGDLETPFPRAINGRRRSLLAVAVAFLVVLGACSNGDDSSDAGGGEADDVPEEKDEFAEGPAPARWDEDVAYRVDEVSLDGKQLRVVITVAARVEKTLFDEDIRLVTNAGVDLPRADEQRRTIPAGSVATLTIESDAITEPVRTVELRAFGMDTTVDLPEDGERLRWAPAPERQVGFTDGLMRDRSPVAVIPYTFRTEGLVSELTFLAVTQGTTNATICSRDCRLEDSGGRTYHRIGGTFEFADARGSRVRGTLRFLGAVPPDETELRLFIDGSSGFLTEPDPDLEYGFTLPRAEDSDLSVAAGDTLPDPFDVDTVIDNGAGLQIDLGEMSFYEDRIQLDVTATASADRDWTLNRRGARLRDPSGFAHGIVGAAGGGELTVAAGSTMEASLVFLTPLAASADSINLELDLDHDNRFQHTIELPARPDDEDEEDE